MQNLLWNDIQHQPANLKYVIHHLYGSERSRLEAAAAFLRNDRPIFMLGVASAAYLCMPAEMYLLQHGRSASVWCASDAFYSLLPTLRNANVVINSRSGETAEVIKLAQALVENDIPFVTVTNEPDSTLAKLSDLIVWSDTHKDDLVSINVVTGMMITMLALAAAVVGRLDDERDDMLRCAEQMTEVVARASQAADEILGLFQGYRPIYLLYRGNDKGAAFCGRLVMEEVSRMPGIPLECAEFRQGPNEVIDERFAAVLFVPSGKQGELNLSLAGDILHSGGRVLLVGETQPFHQPGAITFCIADQPDHLRPVLNVVPLQVLAYKLAEAQGYQPGQVRYISKIILTEEGIPNQV